MEEFEINNVIDYVLWRGDLSFSDFPLNEVDAMIFSQLVYLNLDGLLKKESMTLQEVSSCFKNSPDFAERSYMGVMINARIPELLEVCGNSARFKNVLISDYVSVLDSQKEEQFAAAVFNFDKNQYMISFRGTDDTLLGWKEDFNISFLPVIPTLEDALLYLKNVAKKYSGKLYICGHSKGGCAAVYTAVNIESKIQKRITQIYNFDGPGFEKKFYDRAEYKSIEPVLKTYFPENSLVGMVFYHAKDFKIVQSSEIGVMQHDPLSWNVLGTSVVQATDFTEESKLFYKAFNEWADRLSADDRRRFVNILFDIINSTEARTNTDIENNKLTASAKMFSEFAKLEGEDRKYVLEIIHGLLKAGKNNLPMINALNFDIPVGPVFEKIKNNIVELKERKENRKNS